MKIVCIKDVVMNGSGDVEFTKGYIYKATQGDGSIYATNNSGYSHHSFRAEFFEEHFVRVLGKKYKNKISGIL